MTEWPTNHIRVGRRFRKALGDLRPLSESIEAVGLLHPVVITPQGRLVAGRRRLEAVRLLGWRTVPVHVVDLENVAEGGVFL
jgi:ParB family chromosome partitioning protein